MTVNWLKLPAFFCGIFYVIVLPMQTSFALWANDSDDALYLFVILFVEVVLFKFVKLSLSIHLSTVINEDTLNVAVLMYLYWHIVDIDNCIWELYFILFSKFYNKYILRNSTGSTAIRNCSKDIHDKIFVFNLFFVRILRFYEYKYNMPKL